MGQCKSTWGTNHALRQMAEGYKASDIKALTTGDATSEHLGRFCDKSTYIEETQVMVRIWGLFQHVINGKNEYLNKKKKKKNIPYWHAFWCMRL